LVVTLMWGLLAYSGKRPKPSTLLHMLQYIGKLVSQTQEGMKDSFSCKVSVVMKLSPDVVLFLNSHTEMSLVTQSSPVHASSVTAVYSRWVLQSEKCLVG
jgi:hypothetical protein